MYSPERQSGNNWNMLTGMKICGQSYYLLTAQGVYFHEGMGPFLFLRQSAGDIPGTQKRRRKDGVEMSGSYSRGSPTMYARSAEA